ncbi:MAG TPA: triose-phosphate isomerase [Candidatus Polarisedimenticolia bacterium]|jgi:triosephosphate isomerase|nr:triose-phosphate isomerase [Candidatus Polarisedimenticolia bacterium]
MRLPLIVGNWKMNTTPSQAEAIARDLVSRLTGVHNLEVAVAPPFTSLPAAAGVFHGTLVRLAAQDLHWEDRGPYTGAISHFMLDAMGCAYVLVGHSERRTYFGETDHLVNRKVQAALRGGLRPILCVGEEEVERSSGRLHQVLVRQVERGLEEVSPSAAARLAVAYEPVWAIGTGHAATLQDAAEAHQMVRHALEHLFGTEEASAIRILYGGSVTPANAAGFAAHPEVDGVLVGGASLRAEDFAAIVRAGW